MQTIGTRRASYNGEMEQPLPKQSSLRKGRVSLPNQIYHITTTTLNRTPIFNDFYAARALINVLKSSDNLGFTDTLAFVVMPDHLHWLFSLNQLKTLEQVIQAAKSISAKRLNQSVWQTGFYDYAIRVEDDLIGIASYIVANPVRAGLVDNIANYPHWDNRYL